MKNVEKGTVNELKRDISNLRILLGLEHRYLIGKDCVGFVFVFLRNCAGIIGYPFGPPPPPIEIICTNKS